MNEQLYWTFPRMDISQFEYNNKTILHSIFQEQVCNGDAFDTDYDSFLQDEYSTAFLQSNTEKKCEKKRTHSLTI